MNTRLIAIRALDKKTSQLPADKNIIARGKSWIQTIRCAVGMTALQLAHRTGVTQPRISAMERNEKNLKITTMEKIAESLNCDFVYYFKPKSSFQEWVTVQAQKKAQEIIKTVNVNMALENQNISPEEAVNDLTADFLHKNTKRIWE